MADVPISVLAGVPPVDDPRRAPDAATGDADDRPGSRRRRLWELDAQAHCPVVGVCLPIAALRRLFGKHGHRVAADDDYQLHCDAMDACRRRTPLAEALQREFERRYALAIVQAAHCKTIERLAAWWDAASRGTDLAGAVWAALTHPRCDADLQHRMLGEVHMHQHQVGAAHRVDHARFDAVVAELASAKQFVAALQDRLQRQTADHVRERADDEARSLRLRAALAQRDVTIASLREQEHVLGQGFPQSDSAIDPGSLRQRERIAALEHALARASSRAQAKHRTAVTREPMATPADVVDVRVARPVAPDPALDDRAVLCVGGRPASVPLYRRIVERTGGRFLHHDGGDEESVARLDATLAAADLVICQTGCISHDAYWRVKDHCKRTGKPCVFVERPGSVSLRRALAGIASVN